MLTLLFVGAVVGFGVYKIGSLAAKHPDAAVGAGKVLFGLFRK